MTTDQNPPTDQTALRDRIAALFRHKPDEERLGDATPGEIADAVLAVLPPPADRAAILREAADALPEADLPFVPPMDRRRVADWLRRMADETLPAACSHTWVAALDGENEPLGYTHCGVCGARQDGPQPTHLGDRANAENCPACKTERRPLPYRCLAPAQPGDQAQQNAASS